MPERTATAARPFRSMYSFSRPILAMTLRPWLDTKVARLSHIPDFQRDDALLRTVGAVLHAGRTAGVHALREILIAVPLAALEDVHLLPEVMHEGLGAAAARIDLEHARHEHLVWVFGEDLLIVTGRRPFDGHPGNVGNREEFQLGLRHR